MQRSSRRVVGLDFGTTNSALAVIDGDGPGRLARFALPEGGATTTFRSVLCFDEESADPVGTLVVGPRAIERYLERGGRFMQSLKSHLASGLFQGTVIGGRRVTLAQLVGLFLRALRAEAEARLGPLGRTVIVGRPVRYANARDADDDARAIARMREALAMAGFDDARFVHEPVAAAHAYEQGLDHDELVLIADFGGGTSDFTLATVGPSCRGGGGGLLLESDGVAVAGDALDSEVVRRGVAPALGLDSEYRDPFTRQLQPIPTKLYAKLRKWHHLSFLNTPETLETLERLQRQAVEPERIEALIGVVEEERGFALYQAVEAVKHALSQAPAATLRFAAPPVRVEQAVERPRFDAWTAGVRAKIAACVDGLLDRVGVATDDVDRVFLTGGTSLVPGVRALFTERFGAARVSSGEALTTVARGLAVCGR